jgi:hypothetical protein
MNRLSFTNIKNGIYNNLYLINEDGEIENIRDLLSSLSLTNPILTGNVGINTLTPDSALHIVGSKLDYSPTVGIRMGKSSNFQTGATDSYGIELCSDTYVSGGSYIDFTFPYGSGGNQYAGRMFY